jgi:Putative Flp pilus-assembly TadE/G-like
VRRALDHARSSDGQVVVLVVALLVVFFGIAALVIDGGRWFQTHRHLQTAADAAALAGVQALPSDPSGATSIASTYAQNNFSGVTASVSIPPSSPLPSSCSASPPYNCIRVQTSKSVPGTFAKFFAALRGATFGDRNENARATAAVTVPSMMKAVAPVAVKNTIACQVDSCFNTTKTVSFDESNVASSTIGLIDLTCHSTVSTACPWNAGVGAQELKGWIESGYPDALPSNQWYGVKTGQNIGPIKQGFTDTLGQPLYFPVFDQTASAGPVWYFHIIGWSLFVVDSVDSWSPSNKQLTGHFIKFTTSDLPAGLPPTSSNDFGVHILSLVE